MEPKPISTRIIRGISTAFALFVLPVSLLFVWYNYDPYFTQNPVGRNFPVYYVVLWGLLTNVLAAAHYVIAFIQFVFQVRLLESKKSRGALSPISMVLLSGTFFALAILQFLRPQHHTLFYPSPGANWWSYALVLCRGLSVSGGYILAASGHLVLFILCLRYGGWHDILGARLGRVRLE